MRNDSSGSFMTTVRPPLTLRDVASVCFRYRRLVLLCFGSIFLGSLLHIFLAPRVYEAEAEILVKRERPDTVVIPENNAVPILSTEVTEEDLNSEVELLLGRDLLEKVVTACHLDQEPAYSLVERMTRALSRAWPMQSNHDLAIPNAVRALQKKLKVEAIEKTNIIKITYKSPDPALAAAVVQTLTKLYLEKHLEVHRPPGTLAFFQAGSNNSLASLHAAETKLGELNRYQNTVSPQIEKTSAEQKLADFEATVHQIRTSIAATEGRILTLSTQMRSTSVRISTAVSTNSLLLQQLKSTLLDLQLKETELLGKYGVAYLPLQQLETKITQTKEAIAEEQGKPIHDDTTDRNPTYQWMSDELAKSKTDLVYLQRQASAIEKEILAYRSELLTLDNKAQKQQDLSRDVDIQQTNYLLYENKMEQARMSDALDEKHIMNVAVADEAKIPALPSDAGPVVMIMLGAVMAAFISIALAFAKHRFNTFLQNPDDVRFLLGIPVLAAFPTSPAIEVRST